MLQLLWMKSSWPVLTQMNVEPRRSGNKGTPPLSQTSTAKLYNCSPLDLVTTPSRWVSSNAELWAGRGVDDTMCCSCTLPFPHSCQSPRALHWSGPCWGKWYCTLKLVCWENDSLFVTTNTVWSIHWIWRQIIANWKPLHRGLFYCGFISLVSLCQTRVEFPRWREEPVTVARCMRYKSRQEVHTKYVYML